MQKEGWKEGRKEGRTDRRTDTTKLIVLFFFAILRTRQKRGIKVYKQIVTLSAITRAYPNP
jgi:hypothetical protein